MRHLIAPIRVALKKPRFAPAMVDGKAVRTFVLEPYISGLGGVSVIAAPVAMPHRMMTVDTVIDQIARSVPATTAKLYEPKEPVAIESGERRITTFAGTDGSAADSEVFIPVDVEALFDMDELYRSIVYPEEARRSNIQGRVDIRVFIDILATLPKSVIERSDNKLLEQAARAALVKGRFKPAHINGRPVGMWLSIPIISHLK